MRERLYYAMMPAISVIISPYSLKMFSSGRVMCLMTTPVCGCSIRAAEPAGMLTLNVTPLSSASQRTFIAPRAVVTFPSAYCISDGMNGRISISPNPGAAALIPTRYSTKILAG